MPFLGLDEAQTLERLAPLVRAAAGAPLEINVGAEAHGYRNLGVKLPRPKSKHEGTLLKLRVRAALELAGVTVAENALAPKVPGGLLGQVQVKMTLRSTVCGGMEHVNSPYRAGAA
jgi:hypothetical protein